MADAIDMKRKTGWAVGISLALFAPVWAKAFLADHVVAPLTICTLVATRVLLGFFPWMMVRAQERGAAIARRRAARTEAYRTSPESHLLQLND